MLRSTKQLEKYTIGTTDGELGQVKDFYFDDETWVVRYVIVETGAWLSSRRVLISPFSIGAPDGVGHILPVSITKQQLKDSPSIDLEKPVSRQHEMSYLGYYGYPYYWGGTGLWGEGAYPGMMMTGVGYGGSDAQFERLSRQAELSNSDPHLRSCAVLEEYHVHATDGDIGHIQGFLLDEKSWAIRYAIVNTSNWWLGHSVLISPEWIGEVSWSQSKVTTSLNRQAIKDAPAYDPDVMFERADEIGIYKHYGRAGYWSEGAPRRAA